MENNDLIRRIEVLEEWKRQKEQKQIAFPLDQESIDVLNTYFLRVIDEYTYFAGAGDTTLRSFVAIQDGQRFDLTSELIRYVADATSDTITITDGTSASRFVNDATLVLYTTDTAPGGLSAQGLTTYYVINAATDGFSFQLSTSAGGAAVNITNSGTGRQLLQKL